EHESEFLDWHGFKSYPRPVQKPTLPVHIGGNKGKAFERIAKYGAGWYAPTGDPEELKPQLDEMAEECRKIGRDPAEIEVTAMWPMKGGLDLVKQMEDLGVHRLNVPTLAVAPTDQDSLIKKLGDEIIAKL
ncbi:MAG: LLM class flavin-dependent oxidoreductase, partial [Alphaproteobacteria bacterium]|nr:LLM class flavin-dependent oxidoreductase [Alphaproteobacteria bacterium]